MNGLTEECLPLVGNVIFETAVKLIGCYSHPEGRMVPSDKYGTLFDFFFFLKFIFSFF